jgi:hypothetical protein
MADIFRGFLIPSTKYCKTTLHKPRPLPSSSSPIHHSQMTGVYYHSKLHILRIWKTDVKYLLPRTITTKLSYRTAEAVICIPSCKIRFCSKDCHRSSAFLLQIFGFPTRPENHLQGNLYLILFYNSKGNWNTEKIGMKSSFKHTRTTCKVLCVWYLNWEDVHNEVMIRLHLIRNSETSFTLSCTGFSRGIVPTTWISFLCLNQTSPSNTSQKTATRHCNRFLRNYWNFKPQYSQIAMRPITKSSTERHGVAVALLPRIRIPDRKSAIETFS